ncbi:hypothetical protein SAMN05443582_102806 [Phyllobacterium sp. OV277]|nr:hypothetical protein SAMN05443582_102806 [Phyllobacterium sp. OV277]
MEATGPSRNQEWLNAIKLDYFYREILFRIITAMRIGFLTAVQAKAKAGRFHAKPSHRRELSIPALPKAPVNVPTV